MPDDKNDFDLPRDEFGDIEHNDRETQAQAAARHIDARAADPDTTLAGEAFVDHAVENTGDDTFLSDVSVVDVFAVVAAYDHEVGNQTAPEFDTYEHAQDAGIALLLTNANVLHFRIEKRTRIQ